MWKESSIPEGVVSGMRTVLSVLIRIPRPSPAMGVALLALLIAASGAAVAAIPSNGTITACRDNKTGVLRIVDTADMLQVCTGKETRLVWEDGITGKVANSDKLDNKDSTEFLGANQKAADSDKLDGKSGEDFYAVGSKVADSAHADQADSATNAGDADTLDGKDSTEFLGKTEKAADADTLDGLDSTELGAASAVKVGRLELPVPQSDGQTNSGTLFENAAFEIRGLCINDDSLFNFPPEGRLLLVSKQRVTEAITFSPDRSTSVSKNGLSTGDSIEIARASQGFTYGSYFADFVPPGDYSQGSFLQGNGTIWMASNRCMFSATGLGQ